MAKKTSSRQEEAPAEESTPLTLRLLQLGYFPFIGCVVLFSVSIVGLIITLMVEFPRAMIGLTMLLLIFSLVLFQLLWALRVLFTKLKDLPDPMELKVPRDMAPGLYKWVEAVAEGLDLPAPDEIRVSADTVAHVYERVNGKQVLVFGAVAVRALPQPVLAGVVAHELGHLAAGDTAVSRQARRCHLMMDHLERAFDVRQYLQWRPDRSDWQTIVDEHMARAVIVNPAVWAVRLYHLVYAIAHAGHSRQCEYAADEWEVSQVGPETAARVLILLTVGESMPWARLSSKAESWAALNDAPQLLFEEHARSVRSISPDEWQNAIRKELKRPTGSLDSHPCLKDRLEELGISPKQAVRMTPDLAGPPSHLLFGKAWPDLEKKLADRLLTPYRELHRVKMEVGEVLTGYGRSRR